MEKKELTQDVAKCLKYFITDYFKIELEDNMDIEIAEKLIQLYNELKDKNETMLNNLITKQNTKNQKYSIDFPITGKQVRAPKKKDKISEHDQNKEKEDEKEAKKKIEDKTKLDDPDEDGFVVVRKGKKGF